jgi:hypothetical protein
VLFNHGHDPAIGFRPIGECTHWRLDDAGPGGGRLPGA